MIENYIIKLLEEQDYVVVPGFGAFICENIAAQIHPATNRLSPPTKKIAFNNQLISENEALVMYLCEKENIYKEEAQHLIRQFVSKIRDQLAEKGIYKLQYLGVFYTDPLGKVKFDANVDVNLLEDSFGLPELMFKPIERKNKMKTRPTAKVAGKESAFEMESENNNDKQNKKTRMLLALLPVLVIFAVGLTLFLSKDNGIMNAKIFSFFSKSENKELVTVPKPELTETSVTSAENELSSVNTETVDNSVFHEVAISGTPGKYSLIVGSFKNKKNAERLKERIESEGSTALIIHPDASSSFFRVSVAEFNAKDAALSSLESYRTKYGSATWVMTNQE